MEHIAPLIQTMLWVGLIGVILWRFHNPIHGLLVALQKRIESGSNVKAGPFELSEQLKPQDPAKQKEKATQEIQDALQPPSQASATPQPMEPTQSRSVATARYFQAEDLVLRALQAEYGVTMSRQVTAGADIGFDGAFAVNGRLNIVEVKYISNLHSLSRFRRTLDKLSSALMRYGWKNAQIILAVVIENQADVIAANEKLQSIVKDYEVPVVVRCYSFTELLEKFGAAG